ncbi:fimbrial protein [Paraburkholderia fungorum]|uniref:fimbrial protein n=1 Tax=Paraburkholderia fungorum TaxID=134537 RepID=UPI0038BB219F
MLITPGDAANHRATVAYISKHPVLRDATTGRQIMNGLINIFRAEMRRRTVQVITPRRQVMRVLAIFACFLGISAAIPANAACAFAAGSFKTGTVDMGSITVPPNVPVGTVLATKQLTADNVLGRTSVTCGANQLSTLAFAMSGSGPSGIYPTNIPGIGIRVYVWASQTYYGSPTTPTLTPNSWTFSYSQATGAYGMGYQQFRFDLVATGPVSNSGTSMLSYNVAPWISVAANDGSGQMVIANLALTATVTTPTCSVTNSAIPVSLPTIFVSKLDAGSAGMTGFTLDLNCTAGVKVGVTLTDATNPSNTSTTLSLTPDSTATGVGLQILKGSTPIAYGADSPAADNLNQWSAGTSVGGPMSIPLTAQYVRTTGALNAGTVKGLATFTMSYQ